MEVKSKQLDTLFCFSRQSLLFFRVIVLCNRSVPFLCWSKELFLEKLQRANFYPHNWLFVFNFMSLLKFFPVLINLCRVFRAPTQPLGETERRQRRRDYSDGAGISALSGDKHLERALNQR